MVGPLARGIAAAALSVLPAGPAAAQPSATLPETIARNAPAAPSQRTWAAEDIVEVTRITDVAVQANGRRVAFIVKQPSIARDADRYGLYVVDGEGGDARRLAEASFLAGLERGRGAGGWTVRGDFGQGVQLYEIDDRGARRPLIVNPDLAAVGGADGLVPSCCEGPRQTGILSYGWAPDRSALWYSRLRLLSPDERRAVRDDGLVWNDAQTSPSDVQSGPGGAAVELRLFDPQTGADRLIASAPGDRTAAMCAFATECGSIGWADAQRLWYRLVSIDPDGRRSAALSIYDRRSGRAAPVGTASFTDGFRSTVTRNGILMVREGGDGHRLVEMASDGSVRRDLGPVRFSAIGGSLGAWYDADSDRIVYGVRYRTHRGLARFAGAGLADTFAGIGDNLASCDFNADLSFGACVRESIAGAPELVSVDPESGALAVLARPNARYDAIAPLRSEHVEWTNGFGTRSDGYVTYPRDFQPGRRYPAMVITHGVDAKNLFVYDGFQWSFPAQLFAERGYVVLSVNEGFADPEAWNAYSSGSSAIPVDRMQRAVVRDPVATMEAAVRWAVERGLVDPARVGIAGYSRGASITTFALSLSETFAAGAMADTDFFNAGGFWSHAMTREIYRGLFGGPPLDPRYLENYRAISPSARAAHFTGPLLQMHTAAVAPSGLELDQMLKEANVPTEMVAYLDETHVLHRPRTRRAAMRTSYDWFDFWLNGREDPDPARAGQYVRWRALRDLGCRNPRLARRHCPPDTSAPAGSPPSR